MKYVGALVPLNRDRPPPPLSALPMGRAALRLLDEDIAVVLGDQTTDGRLSGFVATRDGWQPVEDAEVVGVYDRFPAPKDPARHDALLAGLAGVPVGNPPSLRALSRDKLACQRHLEARGIGMPPVVADHFDQALAAWGTAFVKPRYGALGRGVRRVVRGNAVPLQVEGALGTLEPSILQQAVPPPKEWAGISTRVLVQRDAIGDWQPGVPVARRSRFDAVVNVARGAEARPAQDVLGYETVFSLLAQAIATAEALADHPDGDLLLELGIDAMIDRDGAPWVIETNTRPWGRLSALAALDPGRFDDLHVETVARPFRFLANRT